MDISKEINTLKSWHLYYVEMYTKDVVTNHPLQVLRRLKETGIIFINSENDKILTFEEFRKTIQ